MANKSGLRSDESEGKKRRIEESATRDEWRADQVAAAENIERQREEERDGVERESAYAGGGS